MNDVFALDRLSQKSSMSSESSDFQTLLHWNATETNYPRTSIHELFEQQVRETPDAVALVFEDGCLTYQELDYRANVLSHRLRRHGVVLEELVGICMERSLELLIGILGILKAGGAYVPLDATYPKERLDFMLMDAQVRVLITQTHLLESLPALPEVVLCMDQKWVAEDDVYEQAPVSNSTIDNLAYVIYTSGSTGKPKGVSVSQRNVVRLVKETNFVTITPDDIFLQYAPISFDAATFEIWGALLNGARIVIPPAHAVTLEELTQILRDYQVTTLWLAAGLFHQMVDYYLDQLLAVRQVLAGGDILSVSHVHAFLERSHETVLINGYGPTENTTFTCCYPMTDPQKVDGSVPIGYPIANTQVYLLDEDLRPVPIGAEGELYAGGDGLARGYLNQAQLTAERFVPHPYSDVPGERIYKTGDRARQLLDGTILFLGRVDEQVKIRGYRIELGEIEAALGQSSDVQDAVVLAREDTPGDKRLVAYMLRAAHTAAQSDTIRTWVRQRLPEYMVPSVFVWLEQFPLSPNGKVDRRAFPAPEYPYSEGEEFAAPRTPLEKLLVGIWSDVLGYEPVGRDDDFFENGGHSLAATRLLTRIYKAIQIELPLFALFEAPTVAGVCEQIERMRQEEQELLSTIPALVRHEYGVCVPLSFSQQRLWFITQLEPENPSYNVPMSFRLQGTVNVQSLDHGLNAVVGRHEILRTSFVVREDEPVQLIASEGRIPLRVLDLTDQVLSPDDSHLAEILRTEIEKPFNLEQGPLLRALLVHLSATDHILLLTVHHIIFDGRSQELLMQDLAAFYSADTAGQALSLPEPALQYADYTLWQRAWLKDDVLEQQLDYWRLRLEGAPVVLDLPTDHTRPAHLSYQGATLRYHFERTLIKMLLDVSSHEGVTLYMTLLAAFNTLLYRYSGQQDIVVGIPITDRNGDDINSIIGFFVNTLALRTDLSGSPTFRELLQRVKTNTLLAYAHQHAPFDMVVQAMGIKREANISPLFQVIFEMRDAPTVKQLGESVVSPFEIAASTARLDLGLDLALSDEGIQIDVEYNTDLFEADTINRMMEHYRTLLAGLLVDVEQPIHQLPLLGSAEREQMLYSWNQTTIAYPQDRCIHHLFTEQVNIQPDAIALCYNDVCLTYAELERRANYLAHLLHEIGVGPDVIVGLCMERSLEAIIGMLGILKAGGAYVPLDPAYPEERLLFMLEDAHASVLVTQRHVADLFSALDLPKLYLDEDWFYAEDRYKQEPQSGVVADNLAYVIYTSGSTGQPKGVMITHRNVGSLPVVQEHTFHIQARSRVLQFASFSFDASVWEITMALLRGGVLQMTDTHTLMDGFHLETFIEEYAINAVNLPPSVLATMPVHPLPCVDTLVVAGEACTRDIVMRWSAGRRMFNGYGPTETTVGACMELCADLDHDPYIGRPFANRKLYVLDASFQPVAIGVPGELYVSGAGLARGYLEQPALTAERFLPDPFSGESGVRLYKTGDLVRYLADGRLEFLGRLDHQVKIRGLRIELGEIETLLRRHPAVDKALVIAQEDMSGDHRLVAYIIEGQEKVSGPELRTWLRDFLPVYMFPSAFIFLQEFPLTSNGKIDRNKLPLASEQGGSSDEYIAPRTATEEKISVIWSELLQRQQISVHTDFFEIGGHSLLATQVLARIRNSLQIELSLHAFL